MAALTCNYCAKRLEPLLTDRYHMKIRFDFKALAYGILAFFLGQLLAGGLLLLSPQSSDGSSSGNAVWLLVNLASYAAPVAAGATAAYFASGHRMSHGAAVAVVCSVLMLLAARGSSGEALMVLAFYVVLGLLGAIVGSYFGRRRRAQSSTPSAKPD